VFYYVKVEAAEHVNIFDNNNCDYITVQYHCLVIHAVYCYAVYLGSDFNLAVWQFFIRPPNLNNANIVP